VLLLCFPATAWAQEPDLGTEAQRAAGRDIYLHKCAQCHGEHGDGAGYAAPFLRPEPRDFTAGTFKFRSSASGELPTDEDLHRSIRNGMPYTSMPAWKGILSDDEITNVVYFLKTFASDFSGPFGIPEMASIPDKAPGYDADHLARGRKVFEENQCTDCHGNMGRGNGKSTPTLEDQWGKHIRPADMTKRWTFRNGQTRLDIYRTFTTGLDGSPMPSYDMPEADRWALVDYVWSLSQPEPEYATVVFSQAVDGPLVVTRGDSLFAGVRPALFPVVGQVIEPGRAFHPGVNAVEVRAVHNREEIAFRVSWHDMTAETTGHNAPDLAAPVYDAAHPDTTAGFSDAVAVQVPAKTPEGTELPYFLFGDRKNAVDLWFIDLAGNRTAQYLGKGFDEIEPAEAHFSATAHYDDGEWTAVFKRKLSVDGGLSFTEGTFVPIAFSVWDGFDRERGNRRGITSWYQVYVEPMERPSTTGPVLAYGLVTLLLGLGLVGVVRWRYGRHE